MVFRPSAYRRITKPRQGQRQHNRITANISQRIYSPYQLLERTAKPDGLMQILSGGYYY
jgi:hypothetical protein